MSNGPSIVRRPTTEKSNTELTNSLRANLQSSKQASASKPGLNGQTNGKQKPEDNQLAQTWVSQQGGTVYVPSLQSRSAGLLEGRSKYDITAKLFFLPTTESASRGRHIREAIDLVLKELNMPSIDLIIISFPDISFDADDDEDEDLEGDEQEAEHLEAMVKAWRSLEELHARGTVAQLGLAEFGSERLKRFLPRTQVRPSVDQINVRDCCVVPKSLILYAKQEKIELLTHNDCTNILPKGTIRELLGTGKGGAAVLADGDDPGIKGDVIPQWVIKYTAVVRDRGVIESKGYFAMAEVAD